MFVVTEINRKGQIVVLVALALILLILFTGLALDSGIAFAVKAKLNAAVDAATLAAGRALGETGVDSAGLDDAKNVAERFFAANFPSGYFRATVVPPGPNINIDYNDENNSWVISADAIAEVPTFFMRLGGVDTLAPSASATAERRDVDLMLVLDTSGSLGPPWSPSGTFGDLQDASKIFVDFFIDGAGGDRLGLVTFASGAVVDEPINKDATRGFDKSAVFTAIDLLDDLGAPQGATASEEAMRRALDEINAVPAAVRSSLRVIVFFSDGAPNTVAANYTDTGGSDHLGSLYSGNSGSGEAVSFFSHDQRHNNIPNPDIADLPPDPHVDHHGTEFESYNNIRMFTPPLNASGTNTRCNVNKAARNMVENVANTAREGDIIVLTLGLGAYLKELEPCLNCSGYGSCGTGGNPEEFGENILKRLANTEDSDTLDTDQPEGLYVFAQDSGELDEAFRKIASFILRLTQ
jgi:Flp pilus assembly protein TadG